MVKIGIPRALFYYVYYPKWEKFFRTLGVEVISSGKTTKQILDDGVREALSEACVPVKVFFGHAMALKNRADYLFIPRVVSTDKKTVYCPKFLGMPDMIRYGVENMPPVIDVRVDTRDRKYSVWKAYKQVGNLLGFSSDRTFYAYRQAVQEDRRFQRLLTSGYTPLEAMNALKELQKPHRQENDLTFAVLGYPYILYDSFISVQIIEKLRGMGVKVVTPENIPYKVLKKQKLAINKNIFWYFSDRVLRAARYYINSGLIDGMIHVTAFGCGPDSLLNSYLYRELKSHSHLPFTTLTIDEHSGEAGISTRLEAFIDMVRRRKRGRTGA